MAKKAPGRSLEVTVERIERSILSFPNAEISSPGFLIDKDTGKRREFDVLIQYGPSHHDLRVAIECRDRSRKVTVNDIEAYKAKCDATGVDKRIFVSPRGYYATALKKAARYGIQTLSIRDVDGFLWLPTGNLVEYSHTLKDIRMLPYVNKEIEENVVLNQLISFHTGNGNLLDMKMLGNLMAKEALNRIGAIEGIDQWIFFDLVIADVWVRIDETEEVLPVAAFQTAVLFDSVATHMPFKTTRYGSASHDQTKKDNLELETAMAEIDTDWFKGYLVAVNDSNGMRFSLVSSAPSGVTPE